MKFKNNSQKIILNKLHKLRRIELAKKWLETSLDWSRTIFTDEKKFNLDGPDSWRSWMYDDEEISRNRRQMGGGGLMVWRMIMPHGEVVVFRVIGGINSQYYTDFLETKAFPLIHDRFVEQQFIFQQDNAPIHVSSHSREWFSNHNVELLEWPSRSPDLNPMENVWKMLTDLVYDGPSYGSIDDLMEAIEIAVSNLNTNRVDTLRSLVSGMNGRLLKVIEKKGNIIS